jgi:hypothetical protein
MRASPTKNRRRRQRLRPRLSALVVAGWLAATAACRVQTLAHRTIHRVPLVVHRVPLVVHRVPLAAHPARQSEVHLTEARQPTLHYRFGVPHME